MSIRDVCAYRTARTSRVRHAAAIAPSRGVPCRQASPNVRSASATPDQAGSSRASAGVTPPVRRATASGAQAVIGMASWYGRRMSVGTRVPAWAISKAICASRDTSRLV